MSSVYKDILLKINYYKEEVIKSFIKRGYFPTNEEINNKLKDIDYKKSLFETYLSKPGSYFNTKEINNMLEQIYKDLEFLYVCLQDILINEYNSLNYFVENHIADLENKAKLYEARFNEEMNSTSFGTTIFFKTDNWDIETKDEYYIIDLGNITFRVQDKIALFVNINNIEGSNVFFKLISDEKGYSFDALPYNYNNNVYRIPGELKVNKGELNLNGYLIVNDYITLNQKVNSENEYKILGGKNLIEITNKENNEISLIKFPSSSNSFYTNEECYIEFYYVDGDILNYSFNKKPNYCNFSLTDQYIKATSNLHKIFIDAPSDFMCSFNIENTGQIYASCKDGIISNNKLIYNGNWDLRDFEIREYVKSETKNYNVKLYIKSDKNINDTLNNVYIKQIS